MIYKTDFLYEPQIKPGAGVAQNDAIPRNTKYDSVGVKHTDCTMKLIKGHQNVARLPF
jgi:hypothetical protein